MRKIILGIATISLTFSVASAVAATQPKAGSTCTKLNQVSGTGAAKILCTKVANRLVWSKAPAVAPIQPIASTPTPTPSPTLTPSPTATKNQAEVNVDPLRIKAYKELHKVTCSIMEQVALQDYQSVQTDKYYVLIVQSQLGNIMDR